MQRVKGYEYSLKPLYCILHCNLLLLISVKSQSLFAQQVVKEVRETTHRIKYSLFSNRKRVLQASRQPSTPLIISSLPIVPMDTRTPEVCPSKRSWLSSQVRERFQNLTLFGFTCPKSF